MTTTIYYPPHIKTDSQIEENENRGYKFWMITKRNTIFHNSIKDLNPEFYKRYLPKPMYIDNLLEWIDSNQNQFLEFAELRNNPVQSYIYRKLEQSTSWCFLIKQLKNFSIFPFHLLKADFYC